MHLNETTQLFLNPSTEASLEEEYVYLSYADLRIIQIINHLILSGTVCLLGIVANIINMIIFVMQGLNGSMNITLFAIAISDLCSVVTLEWLNINLNPFMEDADVPFEPSEIQYLTGGWPHACFARITIFLTIFVLLERYLCVAVPLKVKQIITPGRTKICVCLIYLLMFLTLLPEYIRLYFGKKFNSQKNRTVVGILNRKDRNDQEGFILYAIIGFCSFVLIVLFTCVLLVKLKQRSSWMTKSTFDRNQSERLSNRDKKTMKMILLMSSILIVTFTPAMALYIAVFVEHNFYIKGAYANLFHATWSIAFLSEAINSSVNIILYYKMSSKFRTTFHKLFARCIKRNASEFYRERSNTVTLNSTKCEVSIVKEDNSINSPGTTVVSTLPV